MTETIALLAPCLTKVFYQYYYFHINNFNPTVKE